MRSTTSGNPLIRTIQWELDAMVMFVVFCLIALVVVAVVVRITDVTGTSSLRSAAVERRQRWEARSGGDGDRRIPHRRA